MKHHVPCHSNDLQHVFFGDAVICCDTGFFFSSFVFTLIAFAFLNCSIWTSVRQTTLQQSKVIHFWSAIRCIIMTTHVIHLSEFHFSTIRFSLLLQVTTVMSASALWPTGLGKIRDMHLLLSSLLCVHVFGRVVCVEEATQFFNQSRWSEVPPQLQSHPQCVCPERDTSVLRARCQLQVTHLTFLLPSLIYLIANIKKKKEKNILEYNQIPDRHQLAWLPSKCSLSDFFWVMSAFWLRQFLFFLQFISHWWFIIGAIICLRFLPI